MKKITIVIPAGENTEIEAIKSIDTKKIETIVERGKNPSLNRNKGIKKSKTEFVAFINAHTFLRENWYSEVINFFNKHKEIDIVGGPQLTPRNQKGFALASGIALSSIFGAGIVAKRYGGFRENLDADETQITSANLICRKGVFKKVRFDESLYPGEDPKFISDAKKNKMKIAYSPSIVVFNKRRESALELIKQIFNYGQTRPRKEKINETLKKPFFLIPSIFVLYLIFLPSLSLISNLMIIPLIAYVFLDIAFSLYESLKNKNYFVWSKLIFIYPLIHLSYGIGFIKGIIFKK